MKSITPKLSLLALGSLFMLASCDKNERDINSNISEVTALYAPNDNIFVQLQPSSSASVVFEWEQARAEDGSLVMYELAFDKVGGDFSAPIYKMSSDGNGVQPKLTLSHKDLNKIANLAGIGSLETGKMIWTVLASKALNVRKPSVVRTIEVERPAGFAELPADVFISGDATEYGADLAGAVKMKSTANGRFEIWTQLKPGSLHFTNRNSGTPTSYVLEGAAIKEGETFASPATTPTVYRIELDFENAAVKISEVTKVEYWFSPRNAVEATLTYRGMGIFKADNVPVPFKQESWGRDERYKFRVSFKDEAGVAFQEDWGSVNRDNSRPDAGTPAAWYQLYKQDVNQWDYTFKFNGDVDNKNVDLTMKFAPDAPYTHQVTIL